MRGVELEATPGVLFGAEGLVKVRYLGGTLFKCLGAVTGHCYTFSADNVRLYVDKRDIPKLMDWLTQDGDPLFEVA